MGTSIGKATDWLVANFPPAVTAVNAAAAVGDTVPASAGNFHVVVGRTLPDDPTDATGTAVPLVIGMNKHEEEYSIPCYVVAAVAGPAQKASRDAAIVLYDACVHVVTLDRSLGGALLEGRYAWVDNIRMVCGNPKDSKAAAGLCWTWIGFDVHCKNHYLA